MRLTSDALAPLVSAASAVFLLGGYGAVGNGGGSAVVAAFHPATSSVAAHRRFGVRSPTTTAMRMSSSADGDDDAVDARPRRRRGRRLREKALTFGQLLMERTDTMAAAGFRTLDDDERDENEAGVGRRPGDGGDDGASLSRKVRGAFPVHAGVLKTGLKIAVAVWLVRKWMKIISQDKMIKGDSITQAEDAELHAWTCNNCGATLYVAKGKEWRYFPKNYKCYLCGNKGRENFTDTRSEIIERVGDDYEFLDPWEALSNKERRELLQECGGDEEKAKILAVDLAAERAGIEAKPAAEEAIADAEALLMEGEGEGGGGEEETATAPAEGEGEGAVEEGGDDVEAEAKEEATPEPAPAPKPEAKKEDEGSSEDLDALDMDLM